MGAKAYHIWSCVCLLEYIVYRVGVCAVYCCQWHRRLIASGYGFINKSDNKYSSYHWTKTCLRRCGRPTTGECVHAWMVPANHTNIAAFDCYRKSRWVYQQFLLPWIQKIRGENASASTMLILLWRYRRPRAIATIFFFFFGDLSYTRIWWAWFTNKATTLRSATDHRWFRPDSALGSSGVGIHWKLCVTYTGVVCVFFLFF